MQTCDNEVDSLGVSKHWFLALLAVRLAYSNKMLVITANN
jgi:hypothetical protein